MEEPTKQVVDVISFGTVIGTISAILPPLSALFTIVWVGIRIWETDTVQELTGRKRSDRKADLLRMMTDCYSTSWPVAVGKTWMNNRHEQSQAKHQAKMQVISNTATWEEKMAEASGNSWKDEFWTVIPCSPTILPLILCCG